MRVIKFRAKTPDTSDFVYGSLIQGKQFSGAPFAQIENADANDHQLWQVDPETVGQFTGFFDKNGKEIFEGDILDTEQNIISVEWGRQDRKLKGWPEGLDEFEMHGWIARGLKGSHTEPLDDTMYGENGGIVIGNMYENPELLK